MTYIDGLAGDMADGKRSGRGSIQLTTDSTESTRCRRRSEMEPEAGNALPGFVGEELTAHFDFDAVAFGIFDAIDVHGEVDRAHDAGTELFLDECL